jgi:hypothetical protein
MLNGKRCSICTKKLCRDAYHKDVSTPDGLKYSCRKCRNKERRKWYKKNSKSELARLKISRSENEKKIHARRFVRAAKNLNLIDHPDHCQLCGTVGAVEGHHPDYAEPHAVIWLCSVCHRQHHHHEKVLDKIKDMNPRGPLGRQVLGTLRKTYDNYQALQRRTLVDRIRIPNSSSDVPRGTDE